MTIHGFVPSTSIQVSKSAVASHSSYHHEEVVLAQFSLYAAHKSRLNSFILLFIYCVVSHSPQLQLANHVLFEVVVLLYSFYQKKISVFQHGGDWERSRTQGPKNVKNFLTIVRKMSWACDLVANMSLIKTKSTWLCEARLRYDRPNKCPTILYGVNLWLKPGVSATGD